MLRCLLAIAVVSAWSTAGAETTGWLPVNVVTTGRSGDWVVYEGQVRAGTKMAADRRAVSLEQGETRVRVKWFHGTKDRERHTWTDSFPITTPIGISLLGYDLSNVSSWATSPATCTLGTTFDCTAVTFTVTETDGTQRNVTIEMAYRVRATGIVSYVVRDKTGVVWSLRAVGYGRIGRVEWGTGTKGLPPPPPNKDVGIEWGAGSGPVGYGPGFIRRIRASAVQVGGPVAAGGMLDQADIRDRLERYDRWLSECLDKVPSQPKLRGKVDARFTIGGDGTVTDSKATGFHAAVASCVAEAIRRIPFPMPRDRQPVRVVSPLEFR